MGMRCSLYGSELIFIGVDGAEGEVLGWSSLLRQDVEEC